jgi:glutathione S-transferase
MKLHNSPTSPFVRMVLIAAHERGLADQIALTGPETMANGELRKENPLEKVPALVLDDGTVLFDSLVIVSYLDGLGSGPQMIPADQNARTTVLRRHALADGIMEAGVASVMETRRPDEKIWIDAINRQRGKIERAIDALEGEVEAMGNTVDLSTISVGAALGYVDFRLGDMGWRKGHPKLAAWYEAFAKRPSMVGTVPPS